VSDPRSITSQAVFGDLPSSAGNWLTTPQNDFEAGGTFTWTGAGNCSITRTAAAAHGGTQSMSMTSSAAGNMQAAHCTAGNITTQGLPVNGGISPVTASAWFLAAVSARSCAAQISWYDSGGTFISTSTGATVTDGTAAWVQATVTATAPPAAAYCRAAVQVQATGGASEVHYADDVSLTNGLPELPYLAVGRAHDDTQMANDIQITRAGGTLQEEQNKSSIRKYLFARSWSRTDLIQTSDADADGYAQWVLYVSLATEDRFDTLTVTPLRDPRLWPQVLGREIGDRITVIRRPPGMGAIQKDVFIRGITHTIDASSNTWQTQWDLQDASRYSNFLILDDPNFGKLGSGNKAAY
jgi:hypothetical protein